ncbi:spermine synthase [Methylomicrobium sp. Wu6]|uniref:spermine/spermidine synthase domain-containing protein n=1 Tax=Methylomicrobium sp. Wu6 TaxID=3107928 RepID=UPI002DD63ADD|nr:spermine synthase [Methylomicrobium sp. Wu6]MEC4748550.1 spermine synthase [Methylomicrobium sp. Wu6]
MTDSILETCDKGMYKVKGRLIYQSHDDDGVIEVVEQNGVRSLHFGSSARQSSIRLDDPENLELAYLRAMNSWMLFKNAPEHGLLLGLGGGSLARHLLYHFPDCRLVAVEYRKDVVKVARSHFGLPLDKRLKVILDDGGHYVRRRSETLQGYFCLLFVDIFDHDGMSPSLSNIEFFDACRALLTDDGMLVVNLWNTDKDLFASYCDWLNKAFQERVLYLPIKTHDNIIALAFNKGAPQYSLKTLRSRAEALEQIYGLDFSSFLKALIKSNSSVINRVITK